MAKASRSRKEKTRIAPAIDVKRQWLLLAAATFAMLLPFVNKAFNIDDPLFVWAAQHITSHPGNPYGFDVNWYAHTQPFWEVMQNPPLTSYVLALAGRAFGWSEPVLHLVAYLFAFAAVAGAWSLGKLLTQSPLLVALLTLTAPVFLVSATSVMSDVPMLACFVWTIVFWMRGLNEKRLAFLWMSSAFVVAATLFKYFGIALIPLLVAYTLAKTKRAGAWISAIAAQIAALAIYELWTRSLYGRGLLFGAISYASEQTSERMATGAHATIIMLSFAGGCVIAAVIFTPLFTTKRLSIIGALSMASVVIVGASGLADEAPKIWPQSPPAGGAALLQLFIFVAGGIAIVALAAHDLWLERSAESLLLLLAVAGVCVFAAYVNWTIAARSLLPLVPFAAILIARQLDRVMPSNRYVIAATTITALIAIAVAAADYQAAGASRTAANRIAAKYSNNEHPIWFEGHWGFQYYMQRAGLSAIDFGQTTVRFQDLWITPVTNTVLLEDRPPHRVLETIEIPLTIPVAVMRREYLAGFYAAYTGPLPYAFTPPPVETFVVRQIEPQ
jgi:hypothetical protein